MYCLNYEKYTECKRDTSKQKRGSKAKAIGLSEMQKDGKNSADKAYASTLLLPKARFLIWIESNIVQERYQERTTVIIQMAGELITCFP
jgi:hypothetical protein